MSGCTIRCVEFFFIIFARRSRVGEVFSDRKRGGRRGGRRSSSIWPRSRGTNYGGPPHSSGAIGCASIPSSAHPFPPRPPPPSTLRNRLPSPLPAVVPQKTLLPTTPLAAGRRSVRPRNNNSV